MIRRTHPTSSSSREYMQARVAQYITHIIRLKTLLILNCVTYTSFVPLSLLYLTFNTIQCVILIIYILKYAHLKITKNKYYETMRFDDTNKILLDYISSYTLATIHKISLNDKQCQKSQYNKYFRRRKYNKIIVNVLV